jgi:hypothetical protein
MFFAPLIVLASLSASNSPSQFQITVVDEQTGRGVPLVELRTVNRVRLYTDSNGVVAFDEPGLMNQRVFFFVQSHGYEFPKDYFGYRGVALDIRAGGSARLTIRRLNIAERLYRVTGGGIYRDSVLLGLPVSLRQPLLDGQVFGSDSVVNAVYHGKLYWFWGDTNRPAYPLGNYGTSGATSELPQGGGLDPEKGVDLHYFVDDKGFARAVAPMPGPGPTWLGRAVVLRDDNGKERLLASYAKVRADTALDIYERGLVEFDDAREQFVKVRAFKNELRAWPIPNGHLFLRKVDGKSYIYLATPYPVLRMPATPEDLARLDRVEAFTPVAGKGPVDQAVLDRDADGGIRYAWKTATPPLKPAEQQKLIRQGKMKAEEALPTLRDVETGRPVTVHAGSVSWNAYRRRWVMIFVQTGGTSFLGEVWYAEADTPVGPWVYARKIVTHEQYSFYNPKEHPYFAKDNGRILFFEGTYASTFSGNPNPTPWYDYNQIMYKLDLADPRLRLPVPVYAPAGGPSQRFVTASHIGSKPGPRKVAFFALDRPQSGAVAVYARGNGGLQLEPPPGQHEPLFYALPPSAHGGNDPVAPLFEFVHSDGSQRAYSTDATWSAPGYSRATKPLCLVWNSPIKPAVAWDW